MCVQGLTQYGACVRSAVNRTELCSVVNLAQVFVRFFKNPIWVLLAGFVLQ